MPDATIAEILGCAPVTVRSCVHRALAKLRVEMTEPTPLTALAEESEA
jgi:DNA-directed RNA polymerase specialized sigma24 family protein